MAKNRGVVYVKPGEVAIQDISYLDLVFMRGFSMHLKWERKRLLLPLLNFGEKFEQLLTAFSVGCKIIVQVNLRGGDLETHIAIVRALGKVRLLEYGSFSLRKFDLANCNVS